jgi:hypothetical protein
MFTDPRFPGSRGPSTNPPFVAWRLPRKHSIALFMAHADRVALQLPLEPPPLLTRVKAITVRQSRGAVSKGVRYRPFSCNLITGPSPGSASPQSQFFRVPNASAFVKNCADTVNRAHGSSDREGFRAGCRPRGVEDSLGVGRTNASGRAILLSDRKVTTNETLSGGPVGRGCVCGNVCTAVPSGVR